MGKHDGASGSGRGQGTPSTIGSAQSLLEWERASSVEEIERMARQKFPHFQKVDLQKMDRQTAMEAMQEYERFFKQYPAVGRQLREISQATEEKAALMTTFKFAKTGEAKIVYYPQNTQRGNIFINQRFAEHHKNGVLMERNFREAFRHEMFHVIHQSLPETDRQRVNSFLAKHYDQYAGHFGTNAKLVRQGPRPHAEFFAELGTAMSQGSRHSVVREYRGLLQTLRKEGTI